MMKNDHVLLALLNEIKSYPIYNCFQKYHLFLTQNLWNNTFQKIIYYIMSKVDQAVKLFLSFHKTSFKRIMAFFLSAFRNLNS